MQSRVAAESPTGKWISQYAAGLAACAMVLGWYLVVYLIIRPLADASVVDSWVYSHAVDIFMRDGSIRFAGYSQATPALQVLYGAAWSRFFGAGYASLDVSVATLGALAALALYALLRRCGSSGGAAILATALMIANPCYLFMSFSFMTEIPFLALLIAAHLAFAQARNDDARWLWLSAFIAFLGFMIRPFAAAAIAGSVAAILVRDRAKISADWLRRMVRPLAPFAVGFVLCALGWIWLTRFNLKPWMLQQSEHKLNRFFDVSPFIYIGGGLIGPLFYLGVVLSPMAIPHLMTSWRKGLALAAGLLAVALVSMRMAPRLPATPELSCFAGWRNALLLRGLPNTFSWDGSWTQWPAMVLAALGAAGFIMAACNLGRPIHRATIAVVITAAIYWMGMFPLWLFNDRYYLALIPAACLILALAPPPGRSGRVIAVFGVIVLATISLAGVEEHQRGIEAITAIRDELLNSGVLRSDIDAGYALNGGDLYYESPEAVEHASMAPRIPMITSGELARYTIAGAPVDGTRIIRRVELRGALGCGNREIYLLEREQK